MKTETIEEAAERLYPVNNTGSMSMASRDELNNSLKKEGFVNSAKWKGERSYNEEDVLNLLWKLYTTPNYMADFDTKADLIEWFEQFKKNIESKS